ncbi:MAG: TldD/PmbA family protein [Tissierellia bacterium]|nr:TldD/PmbA family protein [Tissierellia bacterium]
MTYKELSEKIFQAGKGIFDNMETYIEQDKEIEIAVFNGEIDRYNISETEGLSLRGTTNGKMGYSYTEKLDESSIDMLIEEAQENGKYVDTMDKEIIYEGSREYKKLNNFNPKLKEIPLEDKIEFLKSLEREAYGLDSRIVSVSYCVYNEMENSRYLYNTKGLSLEDNKNLAFSYLQVVAREGEDTKTGISYRIIKDFSELDYKIMAKEAVGEAISRLGGKPVKSGDYPVIIRNDVFAEILSAFSSVLYADSVQKGLSLLEGKINEKIANSKFTLIDDPFIEEGFNTCSFDGEGTATKVKKIIDKGILKTYLYNWKSALKDGVESTGNGFRSSYKSSVTTSTINLYVEKGERSLDELMEMLGNGLMITEVQGLHSGLNPISGDFSLSAQGYLIENGEISRPVNLITIAGNFFEALKDIEEIGNDFRFASNGVGSPSIMIKKLSIAGE